MRLRILACLASILVLSGNVCDPGYNKGKNNNNQNNGSNAPDVDDLGGNQGGTGAHKGQKKSDENGSGTSSGASRTGLNREDENRLRNGDPPRRKLGENDGNLGNRGNRNLGGDDENRGFGRDRIDNEEEDTPFLLGDLFEESENSPPSSPRVNENLSNNQPLQNELLADENLFNNRPLQNELLPDQNPFNNRPLQNELLPDQKLSNNRPLQNLLPDNEGSDPEDELSPVLISDDTSDENEDENDSKEGVLQQENQGNPEELL